MRQVLLLLTATSAAAFVARPASLTQPIRTQLSMRNNDFPFMMPDE
eukprot:CAMPEP_0172498834 /NCGR_PEP_ID=MMETSP1066-20121228/118123_1 /TAXON_ID=671091 /ORGANISM="Coscinodiscus wailesii, Strain CCMP2513" /LENGTH=45 /DNA_ID= /DNA_START= /DNA_END= /DNA_ORIENTATION=